MNGIDQQLVSDIASYLRRHERLASVLVVAAVLVAIWCVDLVLDRFVSRVRLTDVQRARLALAAPYFEIHGFRDGDLGGKRPLGRLWTRWLLRKDWKIVDRDSAVGVLAWLLQHGQRSDPRFQDSRQTAADQRLVDRALLAWDAIRVVFVARCAFAVGYLDAATLWQAADAAAALARGSFRSWQDWGPAFVDGRVLWGGDPNAYYKVKVDRLLADRGSVWHRVGWDDAVRG